eukprot:155627_1
MALNIHCLLLLPVVAVIYCIIDITVLSKGLTKGIVIHDSTDIKSDGQTLNLEKTQREIRLRGLLGFIFTLISFFKANDWFTLDTNDLIDSITNDNDLSNAFKWLCLPVAALIFAVGNVANRRFASAKSITGNRTDELNVHHRYLANTLEQTVIFTIIHTVIAIAWSKNANNQSNIPYIACNCCLFVCGRILFYRYTIWPNIPRKRALGFALTFHLSLVATAWCLAKLFTTI